MSTNPLSRRSAIIAGAASVVLHALLGLIFLAVMLFVVPGYKRDFRDREIALPYATVAVVNISDWFAAYWYAAVLFALPLLALDGGIVFLSWRRRGTRILGVLWIILVIGLCFLIMAVVAVGIWLAYLKSVEGLAR